MKPKKAPRFKIHPGQVWKDPRGLRFLVHYVSKGWCKVILEGGKLSNAVIGQDVHGNETIAGYAYDYEARTVPSWAL